MPTVVIPSLMVTYGLPAGIVHVTVCLPVAFAATPRFHDVIPPA